MSSSDNFIASIKAFSNQFVFLQETQQELLKLRDSFVADIQKQSVSDVGFSDNEKLNKSTKKLDGIIKGSIANWGKKWDEGDASRKITKAFGDRIVLLVFGKVNAGKSSFCNFIAGSFPEEQRCFFSIFEGEIVYESHCFKQGVTETTANIQGVELANNIILLDTPGLHSITDENGKLTKRYLDSADAVLWLTPSASPGQVDELDELQQELISNKPLLPVITGSDEVEEDVDDAGNIIRTLLNKSSQRRQAQEEDVYSRALQKLDSSDKNKLLKPISISVHSFVNSLKQEEDLRSAGLSQLLDCIINIINDAANYKPSKARQQVVNYLEQSVLKEIKEHIEPAITDLKSAIDGSLNKQQQRRQVFLEGLKVELYEKLQNWVEEFKHSKDSSAIARNINEHINESIKLEMQELGSDFSKGIKTVIVQIGSVDIGDFEEVTIEYEEVTGKAWQTGASSLGGTGGVLGGAMLGGAVGGPFGAAIGGVLGGLFGGAAGEKAGQIFVNTERKTQVVGVDTTLLVQDTMQRIDKLLPDIIAQHFDAWKEMLCSLRKLNDSLRSNCSKFESELLKVKSEIDKCK